MADAMPHARFQRDRRRRTPGPLGTTTCSQPCDPRFLVRLAAVCRTCDRAGCLSFDAKLAVKFLILGGQHQFSGDPMRGSCEAWFNGKPKSTVRSTTNGLLFTCLQLNECSQRLTPR